MRGLQGTLPAELAQLRHLSVLKLYQTLLSGTLPNEIEQLTQLSELCLDHTSLSGTLPAELAHLPQLSRLDLYETSLSGTLPTELAQVTQLSMLGTSKTSLSGTLPTELSQLTQLSHLYLGKTLLSGTLPAELAKVTQLSGLDLYDTSLSGTLPTELSRLTLLSWLVLQQMPLSGTLPAELAKLTQLSRLYLAGTSLSGTLPAELAKLTQLSRLHLYQTSLSGTLPTELAQLTQLSGIRLGETSLSGTLPTELAKLTQLSGLSLSKTSLSGTLPAELANLTPLYWLSLHETSLSGTLPAALANFAHLSQLRLDQTSLSGTEQLMELANLRMDVRLADTANAIELHAYLWTALAKMGLQIEEYASQDRISTAPSRRWSMSLGPAPPRTHAIVRSARFESSLDDLILGEPQHAALGVTHFMRASPAAVRVGMMRGVDEIEAEFDAFCDLLGLPVDQLDEPPWWAKPEFAEEARECCAYCVHAAAGSSDKIFDNSPYGRDRDANGTRADRLTACGEGMRLADFCALPAAKTAKLEDAHVAALRIYTSAAFKVLNGPLRHPWGERPHPFPVTISFLSDAIGKLRAVGAAQKGAHADVDLWRGMRDRTLSDAFQQRGGTEMAPMSTTAELKVALAYLQPETTAHALLLKLRTDSFMGRGASLQWLSAFPGEDEVLFPPLTYLKPSGKPPETVKCKDGRAVTVVEVVPHLGSV